jgi:D-xylose transport system substrate-binding protein
MEDGDNPDWVDPAMQKAVLAAGALFKETNAKSFTESQPKDIDGLVAAGAKVLVVEPGIDSAILPGLQRASKAGIPVITIDRSVDHSGALHVAADPVEQGRQAAKALLEVKPKGKYAIIKGDSSSPESELIASGIMEILQPAVDRGDIKIVAAVDTHWWDPGYAMVEMRTILTQNGGRIDAVAVEYDAMAYGVAEVLKEAGLTGKVAVGGVYLIGTGTLGFAGIMDGRQAVDVWTDPELYGTTVGQAAVALCRDPDVTKVKGAASVTWPGRDPMTALLLTPVAITKDNLGDVVNSSLTWRQVICPILSRPGVPAACRIGPVPSASASA